MNILLTGGDGYLGWPTVLKFSVNFSESRIIAVDNMARRKWVEDVGSVSAIKIEPIKRRIDAAFKHGFSNISFIDLDLCDYTNVKDLIAIYKPEVVVHTAAQPSAPYAHLSAENTHFTQKNNMDMTRNLLWALKGNGLLKSHFIETTTTGIYGAPALNIPEGAITVLGADNTKDIVPYPNMASSWYHVSKGFNATNMQLMNFQTRMPITDIRTSIIYGTDTNEIRGISELSTRFDFDFYFGTLINRWCAMAVIEEPLTVYGSGNQIKPFIHLEDAVQSLVDVVKKGNNCEYLVYNQLTEYIKIKELASMIVESMEDRGHIVKINNIQNPRVEKEDKEYRFENSRFVKLLSSVPRTMKNSIGEILDALIPHKERIKQFKDRLMG
jgi:nucleoside-diphosphate-sugar epimerase